MCHALPAVAVSWPCRDVNCCSMTPALLTWKRTEMPWRFRNNRLFLFCSSKMKASKHSFRHERFLTSDEGCPSCFLSVRYLVIFREGKRQAEVGTPCGQPRKACSFEVSHPTFGSVSQNNWGKFIIVEPALIMPRGGKSSSSKGVEREVPEISLSAKNLTHTCWLFCAKAGPSIKADEGQAELWFHPSEEFDHSKVIHVSQIVFEPLPCVSAT